MKRTVGTVVSAVVVIALLVLGFVFDGFALTETQSETLKILLIVCGCSVAFCFVVGELAQPVQFLRYPLFYLDCLHS